MFYCYILSDPRDGKPFYIGKGKGPRMFDHWKKRKKLKNLDLSRKLLLLESAGLKPVYKQVFFTSDEQVAFRKEIELIAFYGRKNLCNATDGGEGISGMISRDKPSIHMASRTDASPLLQAFARKIRETYDSTKI